jgi:hypothetical protein
VGSMSSSSQGSAPWDNPFERANNLTKGRSRTSKPSSGGRVVGLGGSTKLGVFYRENPKTRKERKSNDGGQEMQALKTQVAQIPQMVQEQVEWQVSDQVDWRVNEQMDQRVSDHPPS